MATSVLLACGLSEQKLSSYVHISEESGVDGSFLISSILAQRLRIPNSGSILICLHHAYEHYINAGMRLGYNLRTAKGKTFSVIDSFKEIGMNFVNSNWLLEPENILKNLLNTIQKEINETFSNKSTITIIIDDLSFLLNLGVNKNDIIKFCKFLKTYEKQKENFSFITKLNNSEIFEFLDNKLITISEQNIKLETLKSGNFKEVDGKIIISKIVSNGIFNFDKIEKNILYKVNERNIKIFNPGEIGIKI